MDYIENQKEIFKKIIEIYEENTFQEELKLKRDHIIKAFEEIFNSEAEKFELKYCNSIHKGNFFKFESRIKKNISLNEKFFRKNIGLDLIRNLNIDLTNINNIDKKLEIIKKIKFWNDVIGIRILTELKRDCEKTLKLIQNNIPMFRDKGIKLDEIDSQPQPMKNGLEIIKIDGLYQNEFAFELQIKSKINSAWGDLDHKLFYKNYYISPVKDSLQVSMNNIGIILDQLEKFLFELRQSNNNLNEKLENQNIIEDIYTKICPQINEKLKIEYNLKKILDYLIFFYKELKIEEKALRELNFSYFEKVDNFENHKMYEKIRNYNFDYILLEIIFFNWYIFFKNVNIQEVNYDIILNEYFKLLSKYMDFKINSNLDFQENNYDEIYRKIEILLKYVDNPEILTDYSTYQKLIIIDKFIIDIFEENDSFNIEPQIFKNIVANSAFSKKNNYLKEVFDDNVDYIGFLNTLNKYIENSKNKEDLLDLSKKIFISVSETIKDLEE